MSTDNLKKIVLACSGASGMLYAKLLIDKLSSSGEIEKIALVFTENAVKIWESELHTAIPSAEGKIELFENNDFYAIRFRKLQIFCYDNLSFVNGDVGENSQWNIRLFNITYC